MFINNDINLLGDQLDLSSLDEITQLAIDLDIFKEVEDHSVRLCESRDRDFKDCVRKDTAKDGTFSYIISFVGDDEIVTTDSYSLAPTLISCGPVLFEVRLSPPDVGFSHEVGNYSEGFILMPITSECSFDAINRRHRSNGVPFVLDHIKVKQLSAVRKQSELDLDFESKYSRLTDTVSWVHEDWFTYPLHQTSLILATAVFDFRNARNFPFLFKSEGGCGGFPPFKNLDTIRSALHYFNNGKSQSTILEIMRESVSINDGTMKPQDNLYLRGTHLAQAGEQVYKKYLKSFKYLRSLNPEERSYWTNLVLDEDPLPPALEEAGATIDSEDFLMGSTISKLRNDGLIMTDLDVRISLMNQLKVEHLLGNKNMGEVLKDLEIEKRKAKELPWKELPKYLPKHIDADPIKRNARIVISNYIKMHMESPFISSFHYQDRIKIYSAFEVKDYLISLNKNLRSEVVAMLPVSRGLKKAFSTNLKAIQMSSAERWIQSKPLKELFNLPIPAGVGPDDSRIIREALQIMKTSDPKTTTKHFLLVSNDKKLFNEFHILMHRFYRQKRWTLCRLDVRAYFLLCHRHRRVKDGVLPIFNWLGNCQSSFPELIERISPQRREENRVYELSVFFDSANICRSFESIEFKNSILIQRVKGFLPRGVLETIPEIVGLPFDQLKSLPFWERGTNIIRKGNYELSDRTLIVLDNDLPLMWR